MENEKMETVEIPTAEYSRIQRMINRKEIPFETVENAVIFASKKLLKETIKN